ncbi:MAG: divalent-cation tolerance protein CutA [Thermoplasmata archaeon]
MKLQEETADGIVVITTVEKESDAEKIATALLEKKLAGCVQIIGPIKSRYWWNGKIESACEFLCLIKTVKERYTEVEKELRNLHPYSVPEIVGLETTFCVQDYLQWLKNSTGGVSL